MTPTTTRPGQAVPELLASRAHTAAFVGVFLLLTVAGSLFQLSAPSHPGRLQQHPGVIRLYVSLIVAEWALVFWVSRGVRRSGTRLGDLPGGRWSSPTQIGTDALIAAAIWTLWVGGQLARDHWFGPDPAASIGTLLPRQPIEAVLWIALSVSAGFCEEVAFRGYLQRQFAALTGNSVLAVVMQAVLFGISHGYQGVRATATIAAYGMLLGLVALWRRSLRPGMLAHAWSDIFAGLLVR